MSEPGDVSESSTDALQDGSVSRRNFLKALGTTAVASAAAQTKAVAQELQKYNDEKIHGPGAVPVALKINGETRKFEIEPRVTGAARRNDRRFDTAPAHRFHNVGDKIGSRADDHNAHSGFACARFKHFGRRGDPSPGVNVQAGNTE